MANAAGEGGERRGKEGRTGEAGDEIHAGRKKGRERSWKMRRGEAEEEGDGLCVLPKERLPYLGKLTAHSPED